MLGREHVNIIRLVVVQKIVSVVLVLKRRRKDDIKTIGLPELWWCSKSGT